MPNYTVTRRAMLSTPVVLQATVQAETAANALAQFDEAAATVIRQFPEDAALHLQPHEEDCAIENGPQQLAADVVYKMQLLDEIHFIRGPQPLCVVDRTDIDTLNTVEQLLDGLNIFPVDLGELTEEFQTFYMASNPDDSNLEACLYSAWSAEFLAEFLNEQQGVSFEDFSEFSDGCFPIATLQSGENSLLLAYDQHERLGIKAFWEAQKPSSPGDWLRMDRIAEHVTDPGGKALALTLHTWAGQSSSDSWKLDHLVAVNAAASRQAIHAVVECVKTLVRAAERSGAQQPKSVH